MTPRALTEFVAALRQEPGLAHCDRWELAEATAKFITRLRIVAAEKKKAPVEAGAVKENCHGRNITPAGSGQATAD